MWPRSPRTDMHPPSLRNATAADYDLYVRFQAELGVDDPPWPSERWEKECVERTAFLVEAGVDAGYAFWDHAGPGVPEAYVRHVVIAPERRGRGLGGVLMRALAARFRGAGARQWRLNVLRENRPAIALYERLGMRVVYATSVMRIPWERIDELPAPSVRVLDSDPRDDADLERRFELMPGQASGARARSGVRVLVARANSGAAVGLAVFDPNFPGSFPFRCASPDHVRAFASAMRERYRGERPYLQLVVEDAPAVADALAAAGAACVHDILHMRGEIPS